MVFIGRHHLSVVTNRSAKGKRVIAALIVSREHPYRSIRVTMLAAPVTLNTSSDLELTIAVFGTVI